jgi:hypothetical protein
MKRLLAFISLLLYIGYITGISLVSFTQQTPFIYTDEQGTVYNYPQQSAEILGENCFDNVSSKYTVPVHSHTVVIGKTKLPYAFSCPVITAGLAFTRFQNTDKFSAEKFASQPLFSAPIFLRNCILRI